MATTSQTTHTYTCDLCDRERRKDQLQMLGRVRSHRVAPMADGNGCDVCDDCQGRPIRDLIRMLGIINTPVPPPPDRQPRDARLT
jgi:hypothetical protein